MILALQVKCPICKAKAGEACTPMEGEVADSIRFKEKTSCEKYGGHISRGFRRQLVAKRLGLNNDLNAAEYWKV